MKKAELLAPAGNMEALKAAVAGGADAVYLGGQNFSARAQAGNFSHDELTEAVRYCHIHDVSVYVTMNTLVYEEELEAAKREVRFLYQAGVDALLVQDLGLFHWIRTCLPDFPLHCSTQMHIHNPAGTEVMRAAGASRVVLARETPLEIVRECCRKGIEIETFVYGALCISYSGQCLMSAVTKGRSGNRGVCAQCCRLRYRWNDGTSSIEDPRGQYLLSPRDLNILDELPILLQAGVASLKIEGRMKRPEYVYLVTKTFREAIDAYYSGREYRLSAQRKEELMLLFNRGFTKGHLFHDPLEDRMSPFRPNHMGLREGVVEEQKDGRILVRLEAPLYQHDGLRVICADRDVGVTAVRIYENGLLVAEAQKGSHVWLVCPDPVRKGSVLVKTTDSRLNQRIADAISRGPEKIPVWITYQAEAGKPMSVRIRDDCGREAAAETAEICQQARTAPLSADQIAESLKKTGDTPFAVRDVQGAADNIFLPVKSINDVRRRAFQKLEDLRAVRRTPAPEQPYQMTLSNSVLSHRLNAEISGTEQICDPRFFYVSETVTDPGVRLKTPVVDEDCRAENALEDAVISQIGDLGRTLKNVTAAMSFNCTNSYSLAWLLSRPGVNAVVLSSEMKDSQVDAAIQAFAARYGFMPNALRLVYGRRPLMLIKGGLQDSVRKMPYLEDIHAEKFPLVYNESGSLCKVMEPAPMKLTAGRASGIYLILTDETADQAKAIEEETADEEVHEGI
jgi:putative protease